jgi:hypothetical protein
MLTRQKKRQSMEQERRTVFVPWFVYTTCEGTPALSNATFAIRLAVNTPVTASLNFHLSTSHNGNPVTASFTAEYLLRKALECCTCTQDSPIRYRTRHVGNPSNIPPSHKHTCNRGHGNCTLQSVNVIPDERNAPIPEKIETPPQLLHKYHRMQSGTVHLQCRCKSWVGNVGCTASAAG